MRTSTAVAWIGESRVWRTTRLWLAAAAAEFSFPTDGAGKPVLVPSPVSALRARAIAGGKVRVTWEYDETLAIAPTDHFEVDFVSLDGASPLAM